jgi:hypothetical protein
MEAYNQDLLKDAVYHLDNLKFDLTKLKLAYNRDREIMTYVDGFLYNCDLIQLMIERYDTYNCIRLCNIINNTFLDLNSHGALIFMPKKCFGKDYNRGKMTQINFDL